ncbi:MAG: nucleoside hydrolase [Chloroflexota bacterium]|nr:nucleoside hydrolase [Chloroflexota bacterium]
MPTRVILDTDIGSDVDDILALSLILCSPELKLEGVTCVYADVQLRARMALKLLRLAERSDVPVMAGVSNPLLGLAPVYWAGHEGVGLLEPEDDGLLPSPEHAADFLVRAVMENPGEIQLIAIGPLTNVALAFLREPKLPRNLARLVIMGGAARVAARAADLPLSEHNIRCDPEAAHIVLSAGAPTTVIPLDVTQRVLIRLDGVERIRAGGAPFHDAVARQVELYPRYKERGSTFLHDPLAVASVILPDLVSLHPLHIDVELGGRFSAGATLMRTASADAPPTADVALDVQAGAFEQFLIERLSTSPTSHPVET